MDKVSSYVKRFVPWAPMAILGIAGLVVVYSLMTFFRVLSVGPSHYHSTVSLKGTAPRASVPAQDISTLFGKAPALLKVSEGGLLLRGIFATASPERGSAIIGSQGQKPKLYVVGDRLPNGTTLVAVHEQQVVLEKAGEQSMLSLPESRL